MDWKRLLKLEQYEVLGLDIGSSVVKMVQLRKNNTGYTVTAAGIVDIVDEAESSKNRKEANTVKAISKCFKSAGMWTRLAVCGVCGPEVAVRYFKFPSLPPAEIQGAVFLEASQVCPFNVDDSVVDYQLIPDGEDNVSGVLVAATNKLVRKKNRLTKSASLENVLMDVDGLALLNCFNECEKPEAGRTTAILNVGTSFANLAIMGDNGLSFIRDVAFAGDDIIEQIAAERNVSTDAVSRILFAPYGHEQGQRQSELDDSLDRACLKLVTDVTETLRYYTAHEKSAFIENIFVCGGFSLVKGFVELLDNQLSATVLLWNPFDKISCDANRRCRDILQKNGPAMAVAAGLAMRFV